MDDKRYLQSLINEGEHQQQDFKYRVSDAMKLAKSVSAFANTDGGIILLGVKEDKNKRPVVDGLTEQEAIDLKKKFWDMAHNAQKVSVTC